MALDVEGVVDGSMDGQKALRRSRRLEALHSSFALPDRQVRILCPIAFPAANPAAKFMML